VEDKVQVLEEAKGPFLTSPLGANFDPRDGFCPLGIKLSLGEKLELLRKLIQSLKTVITAMTLV
jgi:hypothetical protein